MPCAASPLAVIVYVPTASPSALATSYATVSFPIVPDTLAVSAGSAVPYTFVLFSAATVTGLGLIVKVASAVNTTSFTVALASIVYVPASVKLGISPHSFASLLSCFSRYWIFEACTNELALSVQPCKLSFANTTVNSSNLCEFPS